MRRRHRESYPIARAGASCFGAGDTRSSRSQVASCLALSHGFDTQSLRACAPMLGQGCAVWQTNPELGDRDRRCAEGRQTKGLRESRGFESP
jgi:hypothetical protein